MFDTSHPMFRPFWVRIVITVICFGWAGLEWSMGNAMWGSFFGAVGCICIFIFFIVYKDPQADSEKEISEKKEGEE